LRAAELGAYFSASSYLASASLRRPLLDEHIAPSLGRIAPVGAALVHNDVFCNCAVKIPFFSKQIAPVSIGVVLFILEIEKPMAHIAAKIRNSTDRR